MDPLKIEGEQDNGGCGPDCACGAPRRSRRLKWVVTLGVLLVATGVLASHLHGGDDAAAQGAGPAFVAPVVAVDTAAPAVPGATSDAPLWGGSLPSIAALNQGDAKTDAVFVFLPAEDGAGAEAIRTRIEAVERAVRAQGKQVVAFTLERTAPEYGQLTQAYPAPCVLAMARGAGASMVAGEVTEASLMQGYVAASRPRSPCCPTGGDKSKCATP